MEILTKLTPAETLLLTANSKASFKDLLKYTKVLKSQEYEDQARPDDPIRTVSYVTVGPAFDGYRCRSHERVFLDPFLKDKELDILFRHLVKMGYENASTKASFVFDRMLSNDVLHESINSGFFSRLFVSITLTNKGEKTKKGIERALRELEKELPRLIEASPKGASEVLRKINGNVFLLGSFDFELLDKIDDELTNEIRRQKKDTSSGCSGCYTYFNSYSESFDSGFDSADGGSSGCGGGGCGGGGCSGCGGCGGCGS